MLRHPSLIPLSHQHQHALALCVTIDRALRAGEAPRSDQTLDFGQGPQADETAQPGQGQPSSQFPSIARRSRVAQAPKSDPALRAGQTPRSEVSSVGQVPRPAEAPPAGQAPIVGLSPEQAALARKAADLFEIEIRNHFDVEERILFPAIREHLGAVPLVDELIGEHRRLEALIARLPATLAEFAATLSAHIRKEERDLFEDIQKRLPAETLEQLKEKIAAEVVRVCL